MQDIGAGDCWRHSRDVAQIDDGDRVYLLDLAAEGERSVPLALEGTAADIWRVVAPGTSIEAATRELAVIYGTRPEVISADLAHFLESLAAQGILARSSAADPCS